MPHDTKDGTQGQRLALDALLRAAVEELGTDKVIIVAQINGAPIVSVSPSCRGMECGMLAEALITVGGPLEEIT